jgi:hypothetical protein
MKWYDYLACFWFADMIAVGLLNFAILPLTIGILSYILYEDMRKGVNNADSDS